jgi:hypothetical protein
MASKFRVFPRFFDQNHRFFKVFGGRGRTWRTLRPRIARRPPVEIHDADGHRRELRAASRRIYGPSDSCESEENTLRQDLLPPPSGNMPLQRTRIGDGQSLGVGGRALVAELAGFWNG